MGLENRDYYRNSGRQGERPHGFSELPPVCKWLLIANVVVFLAQIMFTEPVGGPNLDSQLRNVPSQIDGNPALAPELVREVRRLLPRRSVVQEWFQLDPSRVKQGQLWRLVTSAFCHDRFSIWHLVFNMFLLYWLGTRLEHMYGAREFALFYFAAAISASVAYLALHYYLHDLSPAIGASGAILGLAVLYTLHHPYETLRIYFLFPIQMRWLLLVYVIFDLHPVLMQLSGQTVGGNTAHAAHLGGAAFGFLYFKRVWRLEPLYNRLPLVGNGAPWGNRRGASQSQQSQQRPSQPGRRTIPLSSSVTNKPELPALPEAAKFDPELERLELSLDQVLEKIHATGRDSLTDQEVEILERASRKYRNDE